MKYSPSELVVPNVIVPVFVLPRVTTPAPDAVSAPMFLRILIFPVPVLDPVALISRVVRGVPPVPISPEIVTCPLPDKMSRS